ncbi:MAG TPA: HTTM domain-containing protein [Polyangiaceae bacterium]
MASDVKGTLRRWRDEIGDTHALGAVRVVVGLLLLEAALRAGDELRSGYFGDVFHWPIVPEALVPSRVVYGALVGAEVLLAVLVAAGVRARGALFASALLSTYGLLCDRLQFHHNRWALACYALLLALTPCDRCYSLAGLWTPARPVEGPLWAARLAQVQVSLVYLASGGSKFFDPDWREGRVLATRMALYGSNAVNAGVPRSVVAWLADPDVASGLAKLAIATELFLSVGLWLWRTRVFALWWGVCFHLTIEATSRVEGFTWLTLAMYALFATPDARARTLAYDPARLAHRVVARAVAWLDWLARFRLAPALPGASTSTERRMTRGMTVVDRDGTRATGLGALAAIARCTPLFFPLWLPLAAVARVLQALGRPTDVRDSG